MAAFKEVILVKDVSETDRYNRLLRYVFVDDFFVNYELIVQGFAQVSTLPPDVACERTFINAQQEARNKMIGLWAKTQTPKPTTLPTLPPIGPTVQPKQPSRNCHPSYPSVCHDPNAIDYGCAGGSGNGPL